MAGRGNLALGELGFESKRSLVRALRIEDDEFERALDLCKNGDPYERWYEPKRSGGQRLIEHPVPDLKVVQQRLNRLLQRLRLPGVFHGSYSATSILTNARPHCRVSWYLTFDLANYYKTIRPEQVYSSMRSLHAAPNIARLITRLTTVNGRVPQGAPTSPMIAAISMLGLARRLTLLCCKLKSVVTIYGDNICVSGSRAVIGHEPTFLRIARTAGFKVRAEKTVVAAPSDDKPLPGLIIRGGKPTVSDDDLASVRATVLRCAALGADGLARRVCNRYRSSLRGVVNHYAWIDAELMASTVDQFEDISWPETHHRSTCLSGRCFCSPCSH